LKKKIAGIVSFLLSLISCLYFSVYSFSKQNIDNIRNNNESRYYSSVNSLTFENWNVDGENYTSTTEDPIIVITEIVNTFVKNIRLDGTLDSYEESIQVYYTESEGEGFSEEKSARLFPKKKNGDIYFEFGRFVYSLRLDLYGAPGRTSVIRGIEINPHKLNIDTGLAVISFGIPMLLFCAVIAALFYKQQIKVYFSGLKKYGFLLRNLIVRDIKTKYRRSVLGILWSVLNPLLMMLVLTAVFSNVFKFDIHDFPVYYLTGSVIFNFVTEATTGSLTSVLGASGLIKKVYIPKYIFPLEKCMFALVNMLFSMIAVIIVYIILGIAPQWTVILFWIPMIYALIFSFGLSLVLATLNVFFRDTGHLYGVFVTAWMYLTPIIYPVEILPAWMLNIVKLNPMYYYVDYFRQVMIYGAVPDLRQNLICVTFAGLMLVVGLVVFKKHQDRFILYI